MNEITHRKTVDKEGLEWLYRGEGQVPLPLAKSKYIFMRIFLFTQKFMNA
jgi:hypothetical protein